MKFEDPRKLLVKGYVLLESGELQKAFITLNNALTSLRYYPDISLEAKVLMSLSVALGQLKNPKEAIASAKKSLEFFRKLKDIESEKIVSGLIAGFLVELGKFDDATRYYEIAGLMTKENREKLVKALARYQVGVTYSKIRKWEEALITFEEALGLFRDVNFTEGIARTLTSISKPLLELHDPEKALEYAQEGLGYKIHLDDLLGQSTCYLNIGSATLMLQEYERSVENSEKALKIYIEIGDKEGELESYKNLGTGLQFQGKFREAIGHFQKAKAMYERNGDTKNAERCLQEVLACQKESSK